MLVLNCSSVHVVLSDAWWNRYYLLPIVIRVVICNRTTFNCGFHIVPLSSSLKYESSNVC